MEVNSASLLLNWKLEMLNWLFSPYLQRGNCCSTHKTSQTKGMTYINLAGNRSLPIINTRLTLNLNSRFGDGLMSCKCRAFYVKLSESIVLSALSRTDSCWLSSGAAHLPPARMILHHFWWYHRPQVALHPVLLSACSDTESKGRDRSFRLKSLFYYSLK